MEKKEINPAESSIIADENIKRIINHLYAKTISEDTPVDSNVNHNKQTTKYTFNEDFYQKVLENYFNASH